MSLKLHFWNCDKWLPLFSSLCGHWQLLYELNDQLCKHSLRQGILTEGENTVDLLIRIACFVKKKKYVSSIKISRSELVSTRRSIVLILSHQLGFLAKSDESSQIRTSTKDEERSLAQTIDIYNWMERFENVNLFTKKHLLVKLLLCLLT